MLALAVMIASVALTSPVLGKPTNCVMFCDEPVAAPSQASLGNLVMPVVRPAPSRLTTSLGLSPVQYVPQQVQYVPQQVQYAAAAAPMRAYPSYSRPARLETESVALPQQQLGGGFETMFAHHSSSSQSSMGYYKQSVVAQPPAQPEPARYVNANPCQYSYNPCTY